jgi:hypothetical protein
LNFLSFSFRRSVLLVVLILVPVWVAIFLVVILGQVRVFVVLC